MYKKANLKKRHTSVTDASLTQGLQHVIYKEVNSNGHTVLL